MRVVRFWVLSSVLGLLAACGGKVAAEDPTPPPKPTTAPTVPTTVPTVPPPPDAALVDPSIDPNKPDVGPFDAGPPDSGLPTGTTTVEVNKSSHTLTPEGLVFETFATPANPPGSFNGPGAGNKAFFGFSNYDGTPLSALGTIVVRARRDVGTPFFYLNLQVDCDGNGTWNDAVDGIIVVDPEALPALGLNTTMTDVTIRPTDPVFKIVGGGIPPGPMKCGLFSHSSSSPLPLTGVPATAKLWNGDTGDNGMPRGRVMPAVLFVLGDSNNLVERKVTVDSVTIGTKVYDFTP